MISYTFKMSLQLSGCFYFIIYAHSIIINYSGILENIGISNVGIKFRW